MNANFTSDTVDGEEYYGSRYDEDASDSDESCHAIDNGDHETINYRKVNYDGFCGGRGCRGCTANGFDDKSSFDDDILDYQNNILEYGEPRPVCLNGVGGDPSQGNGTHQEYPVEGIERTCEQELSPEGEASIGVTSAAEDDALKVLPPSPHVGGPTTAPGGEC